MLPTGKVLFFNYGASQQGIAAIWDPATGQSHRVDPPTGDNPWCGGQTLLADGRVLVAGGNAPKTSELFNGLDTIYTFDPWTETWMFHGRMREGRWYPTTTTLPDGRVLITSGRVRDGSGNINEDVDVGDRRRRRGRGGDHRRRQPRRWLGSPGAAAAGTPEHQLGPDPRRRGHHHRGQPRGQLHRPPEGGAALRPRRRRVDAAGGPGRGAGLPLDGAPPAGRPDHVAGDDGPSDLGGQSDEIEVFSPPYLFKGPRPKITSAPDAVPYGSPFGVGTPDGDVAKAVLVAPGATTHANDMHQRLVPLAMTRTAGGLQLTAPASTSIAPPGHYMLFLVNSAGVPSVARFVHLAPTAPPPPPDPPPPPPPGTGGGTTVTGATTPGRLTAPATPGAPAPGAGP